MNELIHGANAILHGLEYHASNFAVLQKQLDKIEFMNLEQDSILRETVRKMNNEAIAYFNRIGQFYYFARSEKIAEIIDDFEELIPNIMRLKIFRMKQSAHRATDAPRGENPDNMAQLDRLFTYQFTLTNHKLIYKIMLDEEDLTTGIKAIGFEMHVDHPIVISEVINFIELIKEK